MPFSPFGCVVGGLAGAIAMAAVAWLPVATGRVLTLDIRRFWGAAAGGAGAVAVAGHALLSVVVAFGYGAVASAVLDDDPAPAGVMALGLALFAVHLALALAVIRTVADAVRGTTLASAVAAHLAYAAVTTGVYVAVVG